MEVRYTLLSGFSSRWLRAQPAIASLDGDHCAGPRRSARRRAIHRIPRTQERADVAINDVADTLGARIRIMDVIIEVAGAFRHLPRQIHHENAVFFTDSSHDVVVELHHVPHLGAVPFAPADGGEIDAGYVIGDRADQERLRHENGFDAVGARPLYQRANARLVRGDVARAVLREQHRALRGAHRLVLRAMQIDLQVFHAPTLPLHEAAAARFDGPICIDA